MHGDAQARRAAGNAARASCPCPRGGVRRGAPRIGEFAAQPVQIRQRTAMPVDSVPSAARRSIPCWPAIGSDKPQNRRSASASARPVISATAPLRRRTRPAAAWRRRRRRGRRPASVRARAACRRYRGRARNRRRVPAADRAAAPAAHGPQRRAWPARTVAVSHDPCCFRPCGSARAAAAPRRRAACAPPSDRR